MRNAMAQRLAPARWRAFRARPVLGAVTVGLAVLAAGCGSNATQTSGAAPSAASVGTEVPASLTEFHIALSRSTFSPGTYTFVVSNKGTITHAFSVDGPGVGDQHTADIDPGQSAKLTVTLRSGSYDIFCPVDGHKGLGMNTRVSVTAGGGSQTGPATTTATGGGGGYGNGY